MAFITSVNFKHETNSEGEYIDEQNASFLKNIVVEYQNLIEKYLMFLTYNNLRLICLVKKRLVYWHLGSKQWKQHQFFKKIIFRVKILTFRFGCSQTLNPRVEESN